jgi:hypothetical protein
MHIHDEIGIKNAKEFSEFYFQNFWSDQAKIRIWYFVIYLCPWIKCAILIKVPLKHVV